MNNIIEFISNPIPEVSENKEVEQNTEDIFIEPVTEVRRRGRPRKIETINTGNISTTSDKPNKEEKEQRENIEYNPKDLIEAINNFPGLYKLSDGVLISDLNNITSKFINCLQKEIFSTYIDHTTLANSRIVIGSLIALWAGIKDKNLYKYIEEHKVKEYKDRESYALNKISSISVKLNILKNLYESILIKMESMAHMENMNE